MAEAKAEDSHSRSDQNALQILFIQETDCMYTSVALHFRRLTKQKQSISNMHRSSFVELLLGNEGCTTHHIQHIEPMYVAARSSPSQLNTSHSFCPSSKFPLSYQYNLHNET